MHILINLLYYVPETNNAWSDPQTEPANVRKGFSMSIVPEDTYRKYWERKYRGLLVFLLDQSGSMLLEVEADGRTYTNTAMATTALNDLIYKISEIITADPDTGELKDYCDIMVLGYGDQVTPLLDNGIPTPISISKLVHKAVGNIEVEEWHHNQRVVEKHPYWVMPSTKGSKHTEMALALQRAYHVVRNWLNEDQRRYQSFPPIVVNITDAAFNDTAGSPVTEAERVRELATFDGHVLLFNCHLTSHGLQQRIVFPQKEETIRSLITDPDEREWASQLFKMSSINPGTIIRRARNLYHVALEEQARGFIYNASPGDLMNFLRWGTQQFNIK